jgi:hypothetical protein
VPQKGRRKEEGRRKEKEGRRREEEGGRRKEKGGRRKEEGERVSIIHSLGRASISETLKEIGFTNFSKAFFFSRISNNSAPSDSYSTHSDNSETRAWTASRCSSVVTWMKASSSIPFFTA